MMLPRCQVDKPLHERAGGHTTEALALVSSLDFVRYTPRTYIISDGDTLSAQKARELEERKHVSGGGWFVQSQVTNSPHASPGQRPKSQVHVTLRTSCP